jgi:hypothetical protein
LTSEARANANWHFRAAHFRPGELRRALKGVEGFDAKLAVILTRIVGSMACAYAFALLALAGLPNALHPGGEGIISWIAQTFLQLVLLSVIIVGQNIQAAASDKRAEDTYEDADAVLHKALQIEDHLAAQDKVLDDLVSHFGVPRAPDPTVIGNIDIPRAREEAARPT